MNVMTREEINAAPSRFLPDSSMTHCTRRDTSDDRNPYDG